MPERRLYSVEELAAYLGVPKSTVYLWHRKGVGPPAVKVGKYLRFFDVDAWLETRRHNGDGEAA